MIQQEEEHLGKKQFGWWLRRWRNQAGMGLRELADKTHMSFTYLSKIERSDLPPPSEHKLRQLANVLRRDPEEVLGLAKRIPGDLMGIIRRNPRGYAQLLRVTRELSGEDLDQVTDQIRLLVARLGYEVDWY